MHFKKRGQITVFIIVAIVLLFSSALVLYIRNYTSEQQGEDSLAKSIEVPVRFQPVTSFIESCLEQTGKEAIARISRQGGWTELSDIYFQRPIPGLLPGDVMQVVGSLYTPYWFYSKVGRDTIQNVPLLHKESATDDSIERQLEDYIDTHIWGCLGDYEAFTSQGFGIEEEGELLSDVVITDENIVVLLNYSITIIKEDQSTNVPYFRKILNYRLKKMYQLAWQIVEKEIDEYYLEMITLDNILHAEERLDPKSMPPRDAGVKTDCDEVTWQMSEVQAKFQSMLDSQVPFIKINRTDFTRDWITQADEPDEFPRRAMNAYIRSLIVDTGPSNWSEFQVELVPGSLETFSISGKTPPATLGASSSSESTTLAGRFCTKEYRYSYNFDYPILVTITDTKKGYEGNEFIFAVQVKVRGNEPRSANEITRGLPDPDLLTGNEFDCEAPFSGPITIQTIDKKTDSPVGSTAAYYQPGPGGQLCPVGTTGADGKLTANFPLASNGLLVLKNPGYMDVGYLLGTMDYDALSTETLQYAMQPVKEFKLEVKGYKATFIDEMPGVPASCQIDNEEPLNVMNQVQMRIERISDDGHGLVVPLPIFNPTEQNKISLGTGKYRAALTLSQTYSTDSPLTFARDSEDGIDLGSDVKMPQVNLGGAIVEFTVGDDDMQASKLIFRLTNEGEPNRLSEITRAIDHLEECMIQNEDFFQPEFV